MEVKLVSDNKIEIDGTQKEVNDLDNDFFDSFVDSILKDEMNLDLNGMDKKPIGILLDSLLKDISDESSAFRTTLDELLRKKQDLSETENLEKDESDKVGESIDATEKSSSGVQDITEDEELPF